MKRKNPIKISTYFEDEQSILSSQLKPVIQSVEYGKVFFLSIFVLLIFSHTEVVSQELSIEDAVSYLEEVLNKDSNVNNIYGGEKHIDIEIYESEVSIKYIWKDNKDVIKSEYSRTKINYNKLVFEAKEISNVFLSKYDDMFSVAIQCSDKTKNCFYEEENAIKEHFSQKYVDRPNAVNHYNFIHLFYLTNEVDQKKAYNAMSYILYELDEKNKELALLDPFVSEGKKGKREAINLTKQNGVYSLDVNVSGIVQHIMLDSGASDVSLPKSFVDKLLAKGFVTNQDFLTPGLYSIADGSIVENERLVLPYIKVGDIRVNDVRCSVNKSEDVFLLGKTFLDRFKSWKINNETKKLILQL